MRRSIAALALIRREDERNRTLWLAQWNAKWNAYAFIGIQSPSEPDAHTLGD